MGSSYSNRPLAAVTGATSGAGYELARQLARNGYDLMVVAADEGVERLQGDFAELGCGVTALQLDLATIEGLRAFARAVQAEFRPLEALVINAGVSVSGEFARETALEEELYLMQLDVITSVQLAKLVLPAMIKRGSGRLLLTSCPERATPRPYEAVYGASKAFLHSFAASLEAELEGTGVTVTALAPGHGESLAGEGRPTRQLPAAAQMAAAH